MVATCSTPVVVHTCNITDVAGRQNAVSIEGEAQLFLVAVVGQRGPVPVSRPVGESVEDTNFEHSTSNAQHQKSMRPQMSLRQSAF